MMRQFLDFITKIFLNVTLLILVISFYCTQTYAENGGVGLSHSRIIFSINEKQATLGVHNSHQKSHFLVQSWVENFQQKKVNDFIVTPPLFVIKPKSENTLRIVPTSNALPTDRETLYWLNVKAIPSSEEDKSSNTLKIAIQNRIRLLVRPADLPVTPGAAPKMMRFKRVGNSLVITNPSPYYISLVNIQVGTTKLDNLTIAPKQDTAIPLPANAQGNLSLQTVDDYGSQMPVIRGDL